jgi:hypothetical protein
MRVVLPAEEPMFAWCGEFWMRLAPWQINIDVELFCVLTYNLF